MMLFSYFRLIRFPYIFTALAEVWAGYFITAAILKVDLTAPEAVAGLSAVPDTAQAGMAGWAGLVICGLISVCLYAAGMIFNDFVDVERDRQFHPDRPLATGEVSPVQAFWGGTLLCVAGILLSEIFFGLATLTITFSIIILMVGYNFYTKSSRLLGSLNMGLLRGFNFLLGMTPLLGLGYSAGAFGMKVLLLPLVPLGYIFFVTLLSTWEEEELHYWFLVALIFLIIGSVTWPLVIMDNVFRAIWLIFLVVVYWLARLVPAKTRSGKRPARTAASELPVTVRHLVRAGIFLLIPLEAGLVMGCASLGSGLVILGLLLPTLLFNKLMNV
ncbi:MAG: UbiA family prenyltransferase [Planctomycetes bacterium]|nr:UbiA family prenyltransferase [Planctomycetota bacterium]